MLAFSFACAGLTTVTLGGTVDDRLHLMDISVPEAVTPAGLAAAQYIAALPEMAHGTRAVLCSDSLCALTMAACGSRVTHFHAPGDEARAEALLETAELQQLPITSTTFDLMAEAEPLPIVGREKKYYGDGTGNANLLIFTDVLSDAPSATRMAMVVSEAVQLGAWVILADQAPSPWRKTFLELLEAELRYVDCGLPHFDDDCVVQQLELGWEAEQVALLRLNAPMFAAAIDKGKGMQYGSLEERRGFALPPPKVQVE